MHVIEFIGWVVSFEMPGEQYLKHEAVREPISRQEAIERVKAAHQGAEMRGAKALTGDAPLQAATCG